ncbi:MAG: aminoglycoside phosphotransferase family protein, partial [Pseudobdellovibrionaceae bacterium]|nr:aminoglycoside phosphotransferase family protein [Pseudobdellovibrionaceae bacterium]
DSLATGHSMELVAIQENALLKSHGTTDFHGANQEGIEPQLLNDLIQLARGAAQDHELADATLLSQRSDRIVIRVGSVVVKAHAKPTDRKELKARLELVAHTPLQDIFLTPLECEAWPVSGGLLATLWPAGLKLDDSLDGAPWEEAARLLAALHRSPWPSSMSVHDLPQCRAEDKVRAALSQLEGELVDAGDSNIRIVREAAATLHLSHPYPGSGMTTLVHGDWHFGQLVTVSIKGKKTLRLIDPDDMGIGNPAWDLARPAAFFAAGLIPPDVWESFLNAYCAAGGLAVTQGDDPWLSLDGPARALVVQCAASALVRSRRMQKPLADAEEHLIEACRRIARMPSQA